MDALSRYSFIFKPDFVARLREKGVSSSYDVVMHIFQRCGEILNAQLAATGRLTLAPVDPITLALEGTPELHGQRTLTPLYLDWIVNEEMTEGVDGSMKEEIRAQIRGEIVDYHFPDLWEGIHSLFLEAKTAMMEGELSDDIGEVKVCFNRSISRIYLQLSSLSLLVQSIMQQGAGVEIDMDSAYYDEIVNDLAMKLLMAFSNFVAYPITGKKNWAIADAKKGLIARCETTFLPADLAENMALHLPENPGAFPFYEELYYQFKDKETCFLAMGSEIRDTICEIKNVVYYFYIDRPRETTPLDVSRSGVRRILDRRARLDPENFPKIKEEELCSISKCTDILNFVENIEGVLNRFSCLGDIHLGYPKRSAILCLNKVKLLAQRIKRTVAPSDAVAIYAEPKRVEVAEMEIVVPKKRQTVIKPQKLIGQFPECIPGALSKEAFENAKRYASIVIAHLHSYSEEGVLVELSHMLINVGFMHEQMLTAIVRKKEPEFKHHNLTQLLNKISPIKEKWVEAILAFNFLEIGARSAITSENGFEAFALVQEMAKLHLSPEKDLDVINECRRKTFDLIKKSLEVYFEMHQFFGVSKPNIEMVDAFFETVPRIGSATGSRVEDPLRSQVASLLERFSEVGNLKLDILFNLERLNLERSRMGADMIDSQTTTIEQLNYCILENLCALLLKNKDTRKYEHNFYRMLEPYWAEFSPEQQAYLMRCNALRFDARYRFSEGSQFEKLDKSVAAVRKGAQRSFKPKGDSGMAAAASSLSSLDRASHHVELMQQIAQILIRLISLT